MRIILSEMDKKELKEMHQKSRDAKMRDKIKAIMSLADGYKIEQVAKLLMVNEGTIRNIARVYLSKKDKNDWLDTNYKNSSSNANKLNESQKEEIKRFVSWQMISDSKEVIKFVADNFKISYSLKGMTVLLNRLGFVYKLTKLEPSNYDALEQEKFKEEYDNSYDNLPKDAVLLFMDGVHPTHNTKITRAWIKIGTEKVIKSNTGRSRININGAYNPKNQDILTYSSDRINAETTIEFLKKIEENYQDKVVIYIIVDNARYYRNKAVSEYLEKSKIEFKFLPPYSPNLNLIERLWKLLRKRVINNKYYNTAKEFKEAIMQFFKDCPNHRQEIAKFIGQKLHLLTPTSP